MRRWHREEWTWSVCATVEALSPPPRWWLFNLLMFVLAAMGSSPMGAPFLVAWITGDAVLSVAALFLTECP
jgi:hypothetical protein